MRKQIVTSDYRDKEVWQEHYQTKCNFVWNSGARDVKNSEIFFSNTATVTVRSYVDVQEEDHLQINDVEWRIVALNKQNDTTHNCIVMNVEKVNK